MPIFRNLHINCTFTCQSNTMFWRRFNFIDLQLGGLPGKIKKNTFTWIGIIRTYFPPIVIELFYINRGYVRFVITLFVLPFIFWLLVLIQAEILHIYNEALVFIANENMINLAFRSLTTHLRILVVVIVLKPRPSHRQVASCTQLRRTKGFFKGQYLFFTPCFYLNDWID